jgi:uncharacterized membrane protein
MMPAMSDAPATALPLRATRALALACLVALIALGLAWELWLAPTGTRSWALKVLPLAWPLAGVWLDRLRSHRVLSLLVWPYFAEGVVRATSVGGPSVAPAIAQAALALLLFAACVAHIRARLRAHARSAPR